MAADTNIATCDEGSRDALSPKLRAIIVDAFGKKEIRGFVTDCRQHAFEADNLAVNKLRRLLHCGDDPDQCRALSSVVVRSMMDVLLYLDTPGTRFEAYNFLMDEIVDALVCNKGTFVSDEDLEIYVNVICQVAMDSWSAIRYLCDKKIERMCLRELSADIECHGEKSNMDWDLSTFFDTLLARVVALYKSDMGNCESKRWEWQRRHGLISLLATILNRCSPKHMKNIPQSLSTMIESLKDICLDSLSDQQESIRQASSKMLEGIIVSLEYCTDDHEAFLQYFANEFVENISRHSSSKEQEKIWIVEGSLLGMRVLLYSNRLQLDFEDSKRRESICNLNNFREVIIEKCLCHHASLIRQSASSMLSFMAGRGLKDDSSQHSCESFDAIRKNVNSILSSLLLAPRDICKQENRKTWEFEEGCLILLDTLMHTQDMSLLHEKLNADDGNLLASEEFWISDILSYIMFGACTYTSDSRFELKRMRRQALRTLVEKIMIPLVKATHIISQEAALKQIQISFSVWTHILAETIEGFENRRSEESRDPQQDERASLCLYQLSTFLQALGAPEIVSSPNSREIILALYEGGGILQKTYKLLSFPVSLMTQELFALTVESNIRLLHLFDDKLNIVNSTSCYDEDMYQCLLNNFLTCVEKDINIDRVHDSLPFLCTQVVNLENKIMEISFLRQLFTLLRKEKIVESRKVLSYTIEGLSILLKRCLEYDKEILSDSFKDFVFSSMNPFLSMIQRSSYICATTLKDILEVSEQIVALNYRITPNLLDFHRFISSTLDDIVHTPEYLERMKNVNGHGIQYENDGDGSSDWDDSDDGECDTMTSKAEYMHRFVQQMCSFYEIDIDTG